MAQDITDAAKAAFSTSPIKRKYRLLIDWLTNIDQSGTITANEFNATYFSKAQIIDDFSIVKHKPFILSTQNYLRNVGDDDCLHLVSNLYENGWYGDTLSDANGAFGSAQIWQIIYTTTQQVKNITVSGSRFNYPVDFDLYYRKADDSAWLLCDNYLAVDSKTTIYEFASQTEIKGVKIEITKISAKDMYACVVEIGLGFRDDVTGDLIDMDITKELEYETGSTNIGNISANSFSFRLRNTHQRYNSKNTDSDIYQYLKANKEVRPYIGVQVGDEITYIAQGVFFIKNIIPRPEMIVEFDCVDRMALMKEEDFVFSAVYQNQKISEMIETIITAYGLEAGEHSIDVTDDTIPYMFFNPASYAYIIKLLAIAEGGMAFFDELGVFQFKNRDWTPGAEVEKAYTDSNIIKHSFGSPYIAGKMKNRVKIKSRPLYVSEIKNIYTLQTAITISAGETKTVPCYFVESPCLDIANASVTKHADITQDSEDKYNYATFLTFTNTGGVARDITVIIIEGKPLVEKGVTLADEKDDAYITEYSEKLLEIDNPYIQDYTYAKTLAVDLLAAWKDPDIEVNHKALSMPWLQLGDRISETYPKFNLDAQECKLISINIKCGKSIIDTIKARKIV
ncbi:hypothetical protein ES708_21805 [subsurface metagenome]